MDEQVIDDGDVGEGAYLVEVFQLWRVAGRREVS